jgi:serine/threonine-protein kinase
VLAAGQIVDRYEVLELLGQGGLAEVYKVRHRVLGSLHALKVVTAGGPTVARRLLREGSIQAQLRHVNVVSVFDVIEVEGRAALLLEYVEGATLQAFLLRRGRLELEESLGLFAQVLAGVAAAHTAGVLHRDLKPGNILLAPGPNGVMAKVTDFGIAKMLAPDQAPGDTIEGLVMGTPGYMAPEQAEDSAGVDARADVFALGVVLYEMLTGRGPFLRAEIGKTLIATLRGEHVLLGDARPELPAGVVAAVERCLALDREERFADATALARLLFGERPELVEIVEGSRTSTPLSISMPPELVMRAAGVGTSTSRTPAAHTIVPSAGSSSPTFYPGFLEPSGEGGAMDPPRVPGNLAGLGATTGGVATGGGPAAGLATGGSARTPAPGSVAAPSGSPPPSTPGPTTGATRVPLASAPDAPTIAPVATGSPLPRPPSRFGWVLGSAGAFGLVASTLWLLLWHQPTPPGGQELASAAPAPEAAKGAAPAAGEPLGGGAAPPPQGAPEAVAAADMPVAAPAAGGVAPSASGGGAARGGGPVGPASSAAATGSGVASRAPTPEPPVPGGPAAPAAAATAEAPAIAELEPPSAPAPISTGAGAGASPVSVAPATTAAASVASASPPPEGASVEAVAGSWEGSWNGRPFTLRLSSGSGGRVIGSLEVLVGTDYRTIHMAGPLDPNTGRFELAETPGPGWWLEGHLDGARLVGAIRHPDQKKASSFSASRS